MQHRYNITSDGKKTSRWNMISHWNANPVRKKVVSSKLTEILWRIFFLGQRNWECFTKCGCGDDFWNPKIHVCVWDICTILKGKIWDFIVTTYAWKWRELLTDWEHRHFRMMMLSVNAVGVCNGDEKLIFFNVKTRIMWNTEDTCNTTQ